MKLDIGSGNAPQPGYTSVDAYTDADIKALMWHLPLEADTVDEIYSSHALEHIGKNRIVPTLTEWKRVLKPGGRIVLRVPDLRWCCEHWLEVARLYPADCDGWDMAVLFGSQTHDGEYHLTGFTPELMAKYLYEAGLTLDKVEYLWTHEQQTLSFEVHK